MLYDYQIKSADNLSLALSRHQAALDASDTGTGKTYVALHVFSRLDLHPLVVCPKAVCSIWKRVAKEEKVEIIDAINVEKLKQGNTGFLSSAGKNKYIWTLPDRCGLIFDEVHRFGGAKTQNAYILATARAYHVPILCLSATVADNPLRMRALGYVLGLHKFKDFWWWCRENGCYKNPWGGMMFCQGLRARAIMADIHRKIFPDRGCRVRIADLGDAFPETQISAESYSLAGKEKEIDAIYSQMSAAVKSNPTNALTEQLRARQKTELLKVPILIELAQDLIDENHSVIFFVSFLDTVKLLLDSLGKNEGVSVIKGEQSESERQNEIDLFQRNVHRYAICTIQAGGVGLSLHDEDGQHPRATLITPTFSAVELRQTLGRVHRISGKSKSIQRIVYVSGTVEEKISSVVSRKLANLDSLNDGDLTGGII